jgi:HPt (histidine-containing phosphotransfer) domain-containing protein
MSDDPIDAGVFGELRATTGAEFVAELVGTFCDEAAGILAQLDEAGRAGDATRYKRAAHSLKSNANTFGAARLASMAREIEIKGPGRDTVREVADLTAEYERAALRLKELANG